MEVHFTADTQARLEQLRAETGRSTDDLIEDALTGYFEELHQIRDMLDRRYEDIRSGRVKAIPGDEIEAYFAAKSAEHSSRSG